MTREKLIRIITDTPKPFSVQPIKRIYAEKELLEYEQKIRADSIDECIKTITDYCGGLPNNNLINALKQLKEQK